MIRSKYFYLKPVYNKKGKGLGVVEDLVIDFLKGEILGFKISGNSLFSRKNFVSSKEVVSIDEEVICLKSIKYRGLEFKSIKGLEVINLQGQNIGVLEDLIIKEYKILGVVISTGVVEKFIKGKKIILLEDLILGDERLIEISNINLTMRIMRCGLGEER